jgi:hypothetical protein
MSCGTCTSEKWWAALALGENEDASGFNACENGDPPPAVIQQQSSNMLSSCTQAKEMGACTHATWGSVVSNLCPNACGMCATNGDQASCVKSLKTYVSLLQGLTEGSACIGHPKYTECQQLATSIDQMYNNSFKNGLQCNRHTKNLRANANEVVRQCARICIRDAEERAYFAAKGICNNATSEAINANSADLLTAKSLKEALICPLDRMTVSKADVFNLRYAPNIGFEFHSLARHLIITEDPALTGFKKCSSHNASSEAGYTEVGFKVTGEVPFDQTVIAANKQAFKDPKQPDKRFPFTGSFIKEPGANKDEPLAIFEVQTRETSWMNRVVSCNMYFTIAYRTCINATDGTGPALLDMDYTANGAMCGTEEPDCAKWFGRVDATLRLLVAKIRLRVQCNQYTPAAPAESTATSTTTSDVAALEA